MKIGSKKFGQLGDGAASHPKRMTAFLALLLVVCIAMPAAAFANSELPNNSTGGGAIK